MVLPAAGFEKRAIVSIRGAVDENCAAAKFQYAEWLRTGEHVARDLNVAAEYIERAADQGNGDAQFRFGFVYSMEFVLN
jgi:TPR repeat protein